MATTVAPKFTHDRKPGIRNRGRPAVPASVLRDLAVFRPFGPNQVRLAIGPANDHFEAEADRIADQIARTQDAAVPGRMGSLTISRMHPPKHLQRKCPMCEAEEEKTRRLTPDAAGDPSVPKADTAASSLLQTDRPLPREAGGDPGPGYCAHCAQRDEEQLNRQASDQMAVSGPVPSLVHDVLKHPGQPLDPTTRTDMEARFGHDFSHVRVHTDARAAASARAVHALAYTVGRHVIFGPGQYAPRAETGRRLLAHELTHTLQQGYSSPDGAVPVSTRGSAPALQRTCYPRTRDLGSVAGCIGLSGDITDVGLSSETLFLFRVGCDDFITSPTNDEARLEAFARTLPFGASVKIHGFASEEGPPEFNDNLSCLRALKAKAVLERAGLSSSQISSIYKHGATRGSRDERRSVVIQLVTPEIKFTTPENCSRLLGSCEFYLCRERRHPCGENGYYKGYGYKYCRRFAQLASRLSGPGKEWVRQTMLCLQEYIDGNVPIDTPCPRVKQMAFDSHPACYVQGGVCFLDPGEWLEILGIIDLADNQLKQVLLTGVSCFANWIPLGLFPQHGLGAGGGYRGLMERERQRMRRLLQQPRPERGR